MSILRRIVGVALSIGIVRRLALLLRRAVRRIEGTAPQFEQLEHLERDVRPAVEDHSHRLAEIERHLPPLLNAIASFSGAARRIERSMRSTQDSVGEVHAELGVVRDQMQSTWRTQFDHAGSITDLWERLETIRRELMVELRYGDRSTTDSPVEESRIIDEDKVAGAVASGLRVNLGCGHLPLDAYVNVDMRELPGVDAVATVTDLPFGEGSIEELFSAHLVEHFPLEQMEREVLPYWRSRIRPGGTLRMVLPDAGAMLDGFAAGEIPWEDLREVLYGGQEYEGDFHFNMYTSETLTKLLGDSGFEDVKIEVAGRPNGACLEMQLSARTPS